MMSKKVTTISPQRLHEIWDEGKRINLVDVRTAAEYRAGHVAGAIAMGKMTKSECVSVWFNEGDKLCADNLHLDVLYTPGHTSDSNSFRMKDRVFTGDTLLIRGTGRTDFQNGDPAHDYNGMTVSSIGEEKCHNPRLQVADKQAYIDLMNGLVLEDPQLMDVAVPSNRQCGLRAAA